MAVPRRRVSLDLSLISMFSVLLFISSLFTKYTSGYGAIFYAIFLLTGAFVIGRPLSATIISTIAGLIYSFQSQLFLLMLGTFFIRGLILDLIFIPTRAYERARSENPGRSLIAISIISMVLSGFMAGIYQYLFLVLFLRKLVDFGSFIVSTIFMVSIISNIIASYIVVKYLLPKLRTHRWL